MPELQVKKVVAVCFLESAKLALEHVGARRLELSQEGGNSAGELTRLYGDVRRLRDYLQRSVSGYQDVVVLDLAVEDASLLVGCCRRSVEAIESRLIDRAVPPDERQWLTKKRQVLSDWAVEMAAKPLVELPLPRLSKTMGEAVRALNTRIQDKVFGDVNNRQKFASPGNGPSPQPVGGRSSMSQGITTFGEALTRGAGEDDSSPIAPLPPVTPQPEPHLQAEPDSDTEALPPLLDSKKVRDPRLRSLIDVDINAFDRSQKESDYRLSTILLASIVESALLDHAIPRRAELGLSGTPDAWNVQDVLLQAMGDAAQPKDRALSFHLFASRNLLRPALQMMTPAVVTAASFERLHDFARRAVHALGFGAPSKTLPPGSLSADQLPQ